MEYHAVIAHFEKQEEDWLALHAVECTRLHARISRDRCSEYSRNNPEACAGCMGATAPAAVPKPKVPWRQDVVKLAEKRKKLEKSVPCKPRIKPHVRKMLQIMAKHGNNQAIAILEGKAA